MNPFDRLLNKVAENKWSHFWLFFLLLIFLSLVMMFLYQPLCPGQDFFFHYRRLQALMDGMRTSPMLIYLDYAAIDGYGYFSKAFYPDFVLIPFAFIGNFTSLSFGWQSMVFTMTMLCGIFTYITVNHIYKSSFAATISALLYTFCIYRLLDLYHRAAIGETLTFTFIPIVILGLYHIIQGDYKKWYILAIGSSLMIFTHLISSVLMLITLLILLAVYYKALLKEPQRFKYLIIAGIVTLAITAYYIFPMLEQMASDTYYYESRHLMAKTQDSALPFHWLIWGMFTGIVTPAQAFIPGIGFILTGAVALRLFVNGRSSQLRSVDIGVLIGLFYIIASSPLFPWSIFPFSKMNFIQMAWRLFEFTSFFFAVAGGYYLSLIVKSDRRKMMVTVAASTLLVLVMVTDAKSYKLYRCNRPVTQVAQFDNDYHLGGLEYIPSAVPSIEFIHSRGDSVMTGDSSVIISNFERNKEVTSFDISVTSGEAIAELPLIYYKGYTATLAGERIPVQKSKNGLVEVTVQETGHIDTFYGGTILQQISYFITIASIISLCIYVFLQRKRRISQANTNTR